MSTPAAPCLHPTVEVFVLSHEQSLAPTMVHPIHLMLAIQMNQLLVRALLRLFAHVAPLVVSIFVVLPSPVCVALVPFRVAPLAHATPSLLLTFSSYPFAFT